MTFRFPLIFINSLEAFSRRDTGTSDCCACCVCSGCFSCFGCEGIKICLVDGRTMVPLARTARRVSTSAYIEKKDDYRGSWVKLLPESMG
jgi:hypothetical protein